MMTKTKIEGKFYPLTPDVASSLREAKLTAAEWRIWSYLVELDPWGDRYQDLEVLTVMSECDVSKATVYRAFAKLQNLELFDFQDKGFSFKNETGVSKMRQQSQKCDSSLKNETAVSKMRQVSQICENRSVKPLENQGSDSPQTIQNIQTNQTGAGEQGKRQKAKGKSKVEASVKEQDSSSSTNELSSLSDVLVISTSLKSDKASASVGRNATKTLQLGTCRRI